MLEQQETLQRIFNDLVDAQYRQQKDFGDADIFYKKIIKCVNAIQGLLKNDESLSITAHLNNNEIIFVSNFGYYNPDTLLIYGFDQNENFSTLLTHKSNVQLLMKIIKKPVEQPRKEYGFQPAQK